VYLSKRVISRLIEQDSEINVAQELLRTVKNKSSIERKMRWFIKGIFDVIEDWLDYKSHPLYGKINSDNFEKIWSKEILSQFNGFNLEKTYETSWFNLNEVYSSLESSLINQYKFLYWEWESKGILNAQISELEQRWMVENLSETGWKLYKAFLNEMAIRVYNIQKWQWIKFTNKGIVVPSWTKVSEFMNAWSQLAKEVYDSNTLLNKALQLKESIVEQFNKKDEIVMIKLIKKTLLNSMDWWKDKLEELFLMEGLGIEDFIERLKTILDWDKSLELATFIEDIEKIIES